jgi:hypothetical protein
MKRMDPFQVVLGSGDKNQQLHIPP